MKTPVPKRAYHWENYMTTNTDVVNKIVKEGDKWYVKTKDGKKSLGGPYDTEAEAKKRLAQVEYFKHNQLVTMKSSVTPVVRNDRMQDRDFLVVPMVMLVEGVHNGSCGALYYPKDELEKTPAAWNMKPVVVYHPDGPTACEPDILTNRMIGVIMNTKFEDGKLKAEAWLDPERMKKVDNRIAEAIEKKQVMELSTGLFTDTEGPEGDWNTEHYDAVARNYRPDHLAVLPDMVGACSMADGAGFLRLNSAKAENKIPDGWADTFFPYMEAVGIDTTKLTANETSHSTVWRLLDAAVRKKNERSWVEEVFDSFFVYSVEGELFKQDYEVIDDDSGVNLIGLAEPAMRVVQYKTKSGVVDVNKENTKGQKMNKEELIAKLLGNKESGWVDGDKEMLGTMTEQQLTVLSQKADNQKMMSDAEKKKMEEEMKEKEKKNAEVKIEPVTDNKASGTVVITNVTKTEEKKPLTMNECLAAMPVEIQRVMKQGLAAYNTAKAMLIAIIKKNPQNAFNDEFLNAQELEVLEGLAKLAAIAENKPDGSPLLPQFNYSGQADTGPATTNTKVSILDLPTMNFEQKK